MSARVVRALVYAATAVVLTWGLVLRTSSLIVGVRYFVLPDDAMISMRYARNLASGLGLVWNAGDYVQGYTSSAWTLLMASVHWIGVPDWLTSLPIQLASIACHLLTAGVVVRAVGRRFGAEWATAAAALYLSSSCLTVWAISGWEMSAAALGWTIALEPIIDRDSGRERIWPSLLAAGITVTIRPDAALVFAIVAGYHSAVAISESRPWTRWIVPIATASLLPAALLIWQHAYYGSWVPNTVILKRSAGLMSVDPGLRYLVSSILQYPSNLVVLVGAAAESRRLDRIPRIAVVSLAALYTVHIVSAGGDAFDHARFLVPLLPAATILAVMRIAEVCTRNVAKTQFSLHAAAFALTAAIGFDFAHVVFVDVQRQKDVNRLELITSLALREMSGQKPAVIGVFAAGAVPYFNPQLRFHDLLGKSEAAIARTPPRSGRAGHNRWEFEYSLNEIRPDLIITTFPLDTSKQTIGLTGFRLTKDFHQDLYQREAFAQLYLNHRVPITFAGETVTVFEVYARQGGRFTQPTIAPQSQKDLTRLCPADSALEALASRLRSAYCLETRLP